MNRGLVKLGLEMLMIGIFTWILVAVFIGPLPGLEGHILLWLPPVFTLGAFLLTLYGIFGKSEDDW